MTPGKAMRPRYACVLAVLALSTLCGCWTEPSAPASQPARPPDNPAANWLRTEVTRDIAALTPELSHHDRIMRLRQWVHDKADYAIGSVVAEDDVLENYADKTVRELIEDFQDDKLAVWCYGTASTMMRVTRAFGYEAYVVNIGWNDDPEHVTTHAVALIATPHEGTEVWTVHDADYNYSFVDSDGGPLDYFELLARLKHERVGIANGGKSAREAISPAPVNRSQSWILRRDPEDPRLLRTTAAGRLVYAGHATLDEFSSAFMPYISETYLDPAGYPNDVRYIQLYMFDIKSDLEGRQLDLIERARRVIDTL